MTFHKTPGASGGGKKWWEYDTGNAEYEADIDIPLVAGYSGRVMVEDTEDIYSMPAQQVI